MIKSGFIILVFSGISIIGFVVLALIKRNMENRKTFRSFYKLTGGYLYLNNTNSLKKKWLVLIAALIMLSFSLKNFNFTQLENFSFKDILPIIMLTAFIFLLRTSIFSVILLSIQKIWSQLSKKTKS
ncbi:hypothetical protein DCE79_07390 [Lysinibacillus sp. 2017]|nr:hypothetical protein DCE79_07390 [Lysinibacillus sp. 2017]